MLFNNRFIIKIYKDGQTEPHYTLSVVCQAARLVDAHTLRCDGTIIKFADNEYPVIAETHTE